MKRMFAPASCGLCALLLAACMTDAPVAPAPEAAAVNSPPPLPTGAALGGILGGPVGAQLSDDDRQAAYEAQVAALESGARRTWRGAHGAYGYVEASPENSQTSCRTYTQTIYIAGRPQRGHGEGCRQPDGAWRMAS